MFSRLRSRQARCPAGLGSCCLVAANDARVLACTNRSTTQNDPIRKASGLEAFRFPGIWKPMTGSEGPNRAEGRAINMCPPDRASQGSGKSVAGATNHGRSATCVRWVNIHRVGRRGTLPKQQQVCGAMNVPENGALQLTTTIHVAALVDQTIHQAPIPTQSCVLYRSRLRNSSGRTINPRAKRRGR
jgi:hypothetical protein